MASGAGTGVPAAELLGALDELEPEAAGEHDTTRQVRGGIDVVAVADLDDGIAVQRQGVLDPRA